MTKWRPGVHHCPAIKRRRHRIAVLRDDRSKGLAEQGGVDYAIPKSIEQPFDSPHLNSSTFRTTVVS